MINISGKRKTKPASIVRLTVESIESILNLPEGVSIAEVWTDPERKIINMRLEGEKPIVGVVSERAEGESLASVALEFDETIIEDKKYYHIEPYYNCEK